MRKNNNVLIGAVVTLLQGCSVLQAPQMESPAVFLLDARPAVVARLPVRDLVLEINAPVARAGFDTPQIAYVR